MPIAGLGLGKNRAREEFCTIQSGHLRLGCVKWGADGVADQLTTPKGTRSLL